MSRFWKVDIGSGRFRFEVNDAQLPLFEPFSLYEQKIDIKMFPMPKSSPSLRNLQSSKFPLLTTPLGNPHP